MYDKEEELTFRPNVYSPRGTSSLGFFDEHNQDVVPSRRATMDPLATAMDAVVALTSLLSKTESDEGLALDNLQRVIR